MADDKFYPADIQLAVVQEIQKRSQTDESSNNLGRNELRFITEKFADCVYGHVEQEYRKLFDDGCTEGDIVDGAASGNLVLKNVKLSTTGLDLLGWLGEDSGGLHSRTSAKDPSQKTL